MAIVSVYPNEIPTQVPGKLTHLLTQAGLADLASGSTGPITSLQQPLLSGRHLSLTVANSYLLTVLGPCLSSSSSGLVGNVFVWVSRQNTQKNPLTGAHPHPHPQNECLPLCHTSMAWNTSSEFMVLGLPNITGSSRFYQPERNFLNHLIILIQPTSHSPYIKLFWFSN